MHGKRRLTLPLVMSILGGLIVLALVCLTALALAGPTLGRIFRIDEGSAACGQAYQDYVLTQYVPPPAEMVYMPGVNGLPITAANAPGLVELEQFERPAPTLDDRLRFGQDNMLELAVEGIFDNAVAFNPQAGTFALIEGRPSYAALIHICSRENGSEITAFEVDETANAVLFSPDGTRLVVNEGRGTLRLYETGSYRRRALWDVRDGAQWRHTNHLAFSPDGALLAFAMNDADAGDYSLRVWEVEGGRELVRLTGHTSTVIDITFARDGTRLASLAQDGTVRVWGVASQ